MVESLDLEPITVPQIRNPSAYTEKQMHTGPTPMEHYRVEYYKVLDIADSQLADRFQQDGLLILQKLENTLLTGKIDSVVDAYPEINTQLLAVQLPMFRLNYPCSCSTDAAEILTGLPVEVRGLFTEVETLVRLLLVVPVSSSEAERSFSTLRRLKTWLRSTMTQKRQNHVAVCHIHQDKLDLLDRKSICKP